MSYHIEINEYQRRLIMKALTSTDVNQFSQAPGSGDAFDNRGQRIRLPGTDVWYARPRPYHPLIGIDRRGLFVERSCSISSAQPAASLLTEEHCSSGNTAMSKRSFDTSIPPKESIAIFVTLPC